jgi:hypothetical protein
VEVAPFDEGATESALVLRYSGLLRDPNLAEARQRASEVGRQPGTRLTTPWPSSSAHAVLCPSRSRGVRWSTRPKLGSRRQSCVHPRLGHRQNVARRRGCIPVSAGTTRGRHGSRCALGTRTVLGCSFRKSVAEVGKKHLPSPTRGEPRGELKLRPGSTYRRRSPDKKRHPGTGDKGASPSRKLYRKREQAHSIARSRIEPTEGVLGLGFCRALTGAVRLGLWCGGQAARSAKVGRSGGEHERWSARGSAVVRQRTSEIASPG